MLIPRYTGIFLDKGEIFEKFPPKLSVTPGHLHVTLSFRGGIESAHEEFLGEVVKVRVVGYGNDGKNEGLKVELESTNPELQKICDELETPHITLSVSRDARNRDTRNLAFEPLEEPLEFVGRYGVFTPSGLVLYNNSNYGG